MKKPRHVLVTGAGGYIGRHVVTALSELGAQVTAIGRRSAWYPFPDSVRQVTADVLAEGFDVRDLADSPPDVVIHLAWQDGFAHNAPSHMELLSSHFRFLSALTKWGVPRLSVLGSMHEIGYWEGAIDATTPAAPLSLYGIAKNALRQATLGYLSSAAEVQWLRCYYILGDDRTNRSVFTKILEAADRGATTFPFTSGTARYDFIDVVDLGRQIATAALTPGETGIIECCSGVPVALGDKVTEFIEQHGLDIALELGAYPDRPYDSPGVWGDATRIASILSAAP